MKEDPWGEGSHRPPGVCGWPGAGQVVAGYGTHEHRSDAAGQHITAITRSKTSQTMALGCALVPMAMQGQPQSQPWLHRWHVHPDASLLPVPGPCFLAWCWEIFGLAFACWIFSFLCNTGLCNYFCSPFFLCPTASYQ